MKRLGAYVRQLPVLFMLSHTCTVSFFLLVDEGNDNLEECECVKRMETQDIELRVVGLGIRWGEGAE